MNLMDFSKRYLLNETEANILDNIVIAVQSGSGKVNIRDVAQKSFVSTTTVIKLSKKLGYNGYSDMIFSIRQRLSSKNNSPYDTDLPTLLNTTSTGAMESFVADLLRFRHAKIFVIGLGFSTCVTTYAVRRLATLDILAYDGSPIDMIVNRATPTMVIFVSKSGETKDLIEIAERSKTFGYTSYAITATDKSTLAKISDHHMIIDVGSDTSAYDIPDFFTGKCILLFEHLMARFVIELNKNTLPLGL